MILLSDKPSALYDYERPSIAFEGGDFEGHDLQISRFRPKKSNGMNDAPLMRHD